MKLPAGSSSCRFAMVSRRTATALALASLFGAAAKAADPEPPWEHEAIVQGSDTLPFWGFAQSVALAGDLAAVGADDAFVEGVRSGAGYVFVNTDGEWIEGGKLEADEVHEDDEWGWSVAVALETVLVGSRTGLVGNQTHQGAVAAFSRIDSAWRLDQLLLASDGDADDWFGTAMATSQATLIVGAPMKDIDGQQQGAAYIFVSDAGLWTEQAKLFDPNGQVSDAFGDQLALDGDTALIGAPLANIDGATNQGAAYVFRRTGTTWALEQRLLASDPTSQDQFGSAVAIDGDRALVGAKRKPIDGMPRHGAAYFFERRGSTWTEVQRVLPSNGQAEGEFGLSVALEGSLALIGGETGGSAEQGVVYEFRLVDGSWVEIQQILAPEQGSAFDAFGRALALDGDRAIFGHQAYDGIRGGAWILRRPAIFTDGFESGDLSAWSSSVP